MLEEMKALLLEPGLSIKHNNKGDLEKVKRYQIGAQRLDFLKLNAKPFAFSKHEAGNIFVYIHRIDIGNDDKDIPSDIKVEYLVAKRLKNGAVIFAYMWFESIERAKQYALKQNNTLI